MGVLWGFPILLPACTSHHCHHSTPGWILGLISMSSQGCGRLRMRCFFFFPGEKEGYALCLFEAPTNTWGSTCVLGSILGGTFRYMWERGRNDFLIPQTA